MRAAGFDQSLIKAALVRYFYGGLRANFSLQELTRLMFLEPNAICLRVGYSSAQAKRIFEIAKGLALSRFKTRAGSNAMTRTCWRAAKDLGDWE